MYNYNEIKPIILKPENQKYLLKAQEVVLTKTGEFLMEDIINHLRGSSWESMAYVDRLVELGVIRELKFSDYQPAQHRRFIRS